MGYFEGALPEVIVPIRQNLSLLTWEQKVRFWGAIVGGRRSKTVNKENKGISKEGNFIERTYLTNKKFGMLPLVKMLRDPT